MRRIASDIGWLEDGDSMRPRTSSPLPESTSSTSVLDAILKGAGPVAVKTPINDSGSSKSTSNGTSAPPSTSGQRPRSCAVPLAVPLSWAEHYAEVLADIAGNAVGRVYAEMASSSRNGKRAVPLDWEKADRQWHAERATKVRHACSSTDHAQPPSDEWRTLHAQPPSGPLSTTLRSLWPTLYSEEHVADSQRECASLGRMGPGDDLLHEKRAHAASYEAHAAASIARWGP